MKIQLTVEIADDDPLAKFVGDLNVGAYAAVARAALSFPDNPDMPSVDASSILRATPTFSE